MREMLSLVVAAVIATTPLTAESTCFGTTSNGALENGCRLTVDGSNFEPYTSVGVWLGRTYVHCKVKDVVDSSYASLAASHPEKVFVYGETGFKSGGRFKPHKTHQNGLSVDFMVPVVSSKGKSVPLPCGPTNKFGYGLEFDDRGRLGDLSIDYEALAAHLLALKQASAKAGIGIWRVIFDPKLQPYLHRTELWPQIKDLQFSTRRSWVRHDEHFHVDFSIPCRPAT